MRIADVLYDRSGLGVLPMVKVNDLTGEVEEIDTDSIKYQLAKAELDNLPVLNEWMEKKDEYLRAKEQFEMVDKPFRKVLKEIFDRFSITRLTNNYVDVGWRNGYIKKSWDEDLLEEFIIKHGARPDDFKKEKWIDGTISVKYKE